MKEPVNNAQHYHFSTWTTVKCDLKIVAPCMLQIYACRHYTVLHLLRHVSVFSRYRLTHGKQTRKRRRFAATDRKQGVLLSPSFINIVIGYLSNTGPISISHASSPVSLHATGCWHSTDLEHTQDAERNYCAAPEYGTCHGQNWDFVPATARDFTNPKTGLGTKATTHVYRRICRHFQSTTLPFAHAFRHFWQTRCKVLAAVLPKIRDFWDLSLS